MLSGCPELEAQKKDPVPIPEAQKRHPVPRLEAQKGTLSSGTSPVLTSMEVPPPPPPPPGDWPGIVRSL